jgi:hypothetical protein
MAITVKHKFVSAIPDGADATVVRPSNWNDDHDFTGTLPVVNGGTGVTTSSGANSVVLRDANGNITTNCLFEGYSTQAASGTTIVLTASSVQNFSITGSGGQIIKLPDATTLPNGALFTFNNNQSSGAITVQNNSSTTVATINSGGYVTVVLLDNSTAAGSWDRHDSTPSNVSWSTNTLDYPGSITSATWNGAIVAYNRGGTGQSSAFVAGGIAYGASTTALGITAVGTAGQVLTSNGSSAPTWSTSAGVTQSDVGTAPNQIPLNQYLGNMAYEDKAGVNITGGSLSGLTIGTTRINPRVTNLTSSATITPPSDTADQYSVTALATAATIAIPSGTPVAGQKLTLRIKDDGTARALTWTTSAGGYRVIGTTLPTTTVANKVLYVGCIYNATESYWDVVSVAQQV